MLFDSLLVDWYQYVTTPFEMFFMSKMFFNSNIYIVESFDFTSLYTETGTFKCSN